MLNGTFKMMWTQWPGLARVTCNDAGQGGHTNTGTLLCLLETRQRLGETWGHMCGQCGIVKFLS